MYMFYESFYSNIRNEYAKGEQESYVTKVY